jgi:hypothetical protein
MRYQNPTHMDKSPRFSIRYVSRTEISLASRFGSLCFKEAHGRSNALQWMHEETYATPPVMTCSQAHAGCSLCLSRQIIDVPFHRRIHVSRMATGETEFQIGMVPLIRYGTKGTRLF